MAEDSRACFLIGALIVDAIGDLEWSVGEMKQQPSMGNDYHNARRIYTESMVKIDKYLNAAIDTCNMHGLEEYRDRINYGLVSDNPDAVEENVQKLDSVLGKWWNSL